MVTVIQNETQLNSIIQKTRGKDIHLYPVFSSIHTHYIINSLSLIGIILDDDLYIVNFTHPDVYTVNYINFLAEFAPSKIYTFDKKCLLHVFDNDILYDVNLYNFLHTSIYKKLEDFYTKFHKVYYNKSPDNIVIPVTRHIDFIKNIHDYCTTVSIEPTKSYDFWNFTAIYTLYFLEKSGLHINTEDFEKYFYKNEQNIIYSYYNIYTSTLRPSNSFNKVNFNAIYKKDGSRIAFDSRFSDGVLMLFDFESFHIRLIADIIDYELPTDISAHEYFGRQYFNTNILSEEQYEESKKISFSLLYGEHEYTDVPEFFIKVKEYKDMLWVLYNKNKYVLSPLYNTRIQNIQEPSASKVFNYMLQLHETEVNLTSLCKLQDIYKQENSCLILYTYDSLLMDFSISNGKRLIADTIDIFSWNGKYPLRIYYGKNYNDLKEVVI